MIIHLLVRKCQHNIVCVRRLRTHGVDDHSQTRWDMGSTMCCEAAVKQGFNNHSLPRWDTTSTICHEMGVNGWIQ